jgi:DNA/RNA-binding domain of Phe-tRNA-synthetase-like protein
MERFTLITNEEYPICDMLPLQVAVFKVEGITIKQNPAIYKELINIANSFRETYPDTPIGSIPGIQEVRKLFHSLGLDPTKRRPSSEALLRRALQAKEFYTVNNLVDIGNLVSLKYLLPVCIYDSMMIEGDIKIRLGRPGESYLALNHQEINFEGRIVYADAIGPFGSPMTDSVRTSITENTTSAFCQILAPLSFDVAKLNEIRDFFMKLVNDYCF